MLSLFVTTHVETGKEPRAQHGSLLRGKPFNCRSNVLRCEIRWWASRFYVRSAMRANHLGSLMAWCTQSLSFATPWTGEKFAKRLDAFGVP